MWHLKRGRETWKSKEKNRNESRRFYLLIRYVCWFSILLWMLLCRSNKLFGVIHQIPLAYQCATNQNDSIHYAYTFFGDILWHSLPTFFLHGFRFWSILSLVFFLFLSLFSPAVPFFPRAGTFFISTKDKMDLFPLWIQTKWKFQFFFISSVGEKKSMKVLVSVV